MPTAFPWALAGPATAQPQATRILPHRPNNFATSATLVTLNVATDCPQIDRGIQSVSELAPSQAANKIPSPTFTYATCASATIVPWITAP